MPKNFVGEPFSVPLIAGTEKVWISEGGSIKIFVGIFLSHSAKKNYGGILLFFIKFGYGKFLCSRGLCHDFLTTFLSHSAKKTGR